MAWRAFFWAVRSSLAVAFRKEREARGKTVLSYGIQPLRVPLQVSPRWPKSEESVMLEFPFLDPALDHHDEAHERDQDSVGGPQGLSSLASAPDHAESQGARSSWSSATSRGFIVF